MLYQTACTVPYTMFGNITWLCGTVYSGHHGGLPVQVPHVQLWIHSGHSTLLGAHHEGTVPWEWSQGVLFPQRPAMSVYSVKYHLLLNCLAETEEMSLLSLSLSSLPLSYVWYLYSVEQKLIRLYPLLLTIIIIIITFKGAIRDFWRSLHCTTDSLHYVLLSGLGAIMCKLCATHRALIMYNM